MKRPNRLKILWYKILGRVYVVGMDTAKTDKSFITEGYVKKRVLTITDTRELKPTEPNGG